MADNPIKYSDIIKDDGALDDFIRKLDQASDSFINLFENVRKNAVQVRSSISNISGDTKSASSEIRSAAKSTDELSKAVERNEKAYTELAQELENIRVATNEQNRINRLTAQLNSSAAGSYNALSAEYSLLKIQINSLTESEREQAEQETGLITRSRELYEQMKVLQEQTGKNQLNVGNYSSALQDNTSQISQNTARLLELRRAGEQNGEEYQRLAEETKELRALYRDTNKDLSIAQERYRVLYRELRSNTAALVEMRQAGQLGTQAYNELAQSTGELRKQLNISQQEISALASQTLGLDAALGGLSAVGGGVSTAIGSLNLFGSGSKDVAEAQKQLQSAIALSNGLLAIQRNLLRQSALMQGIARLQTIAATKAINIKTAAEGRGVIVTGAATVAQAAFNAVANANPYVLLATALLTVVGGFALFTSGSRAAKKAQEELLATQEAYLSALDRENTRIRTLSDERIASLESQLRVARANATSLSTIQKIENEIATERRAAFEELKKRNSDEIKMLDVNRKSYDNTIASLTKLEQLKAKGATRVRLSVNGQVTKYNIDDAISHIQRQVDVYGKKVQIAVELNAEDEELAAQAAELARERRKLAQQIRAAELNDIRKSVDEQLKLLTDTYKREEEELYHSYGRRIQDLRIRLQTEENITVKQRQAINSQIQSLEKQFQNDRLDLLESFYGRETAFIRQAEDARIKAMTESSTKERALLNASYNRQIEDLERRLIYERNLTVTQVSAIEEEIKSLRIQFARDGVRLDNQILQDQIRTQLERNALRLEAAKRGSREEAQLQIQQYEIERRLELAQNAALNEELRQSEADINAKWDMIILRSTRELAAEIADARLTSLQNLENSEINTITASERQKTRITLRHERERLEQQLALHEKYGSEMTETDVQAVKNAIRQIDEELERNDRVSNIWELFGLELSDEQQQAIESSISFVIGQINDLLSAYLAATNKAVQAANTRVANARTLVQNEINARNEGLAFNLSAAQAELQNAQNTQEKALRQQEQAQKAQEKLQLAQQAINLITASTLIWSQLGFPFAIPAIAAMWASFAAVKIKAAQLTASAESEEYGEGTYEFINGGSHQSGNDVDLGYNSKTGKRRRVEGGEFFGVIRKRYASKYRSQLPSIWAALNNGSFEDKYIAAGSADGDTFNFKPTDTTRIERGLSRVVENTRSTVYTDSDGSTVTIVGSLKKKIYKRN